MSRNTIIGTVVGGVILLIIQWATGYVTKILSWIWRQLNVTVVIDVWLLVLLVILLLIFVFSTMSRINKLKIKIVSNETWYRVLWTILKRLEKDRSAATHTPALDFSQLIQWRASSPSRSLEHAEINRHAGRKRILRSKITSKSR